MLIERYKRKRTNDDSKSAATVVTTQSYTHPNREAKRQAVERQALAGRDKDERAEA